MRMPSTSTSDCAVAVPRKNALLVRPMPPFWTNSNPASRRSSAGRSTACDSRISRSVITVVWGIDSRSSCAPREAVTTTASSWAAK